jgi:hypothetical protein
MPRKMFHSSPRGGFSSSFSGALRLIRWFGPCDLIQYAIERLARLAGPGFTRGLKEALVLLRVVGFRGWLAWHPLMITHR